MANLTANLQITTASMGKTYTDNAPTASGTNYYKGGLVGITSGTGLATAFSSGLILLGLCDTQVKSWTGTAGALNGYTGSPIEAIPGNRVQLTYISGAKLCGVAITGLSSITSIGKPVYQVTDDHTYTLSAGSAKTEVGYVSGYWGTSGYGDFVMFTKEEWLMRNSV
jgi:hypothetical protein